MGEVGLPMVGANAYLGVDAILKALDHDVNVVITGRVADPGFKSVPDLAYVGFPLTEVASDGSAVITKLADAGECVTPQAIREQLLYEVHDPAAYVTPDVVADVTTIGLTQDGKDRVRVSGAGGRVRPESLKVTVAFDGGFLGEGQIGYAGPGAVERARLGGEIVRERMTKLHQYNDSLRIDLIGLNSLHGSAVVQGGQTEDVRLRTALRSPDRSAAELLLWAVESLLCCGPAGVASSVGESPPVS